MWCVFYGVVWFCFYNKPSLKLKTTIKTRKPRKKTPGISEALQLLAWRKKHEGIIVMTNYIFILTSIFQKVAVLWWIKDRGWTESWEVIKHALNMTQRNERIV